MSIPLPRAVLSTVLLVLVLSVSLLAAPAQAQTVDRYEDQARRITNVKRADHDLHRLKRGACVQRFAERHARRMARQDRLFHQDLGRVMRRCNLSSVGENVAVGYPTGRAAVVGWMGSIGHRFNILNGDYRKLGMAAKRNGGGGTTYAVQVFARRR